MLCAVSACGLSFVAVAAVVAAANLASPFARGWWLVAYLFLVGGIAQVLLGVGQVHVAAGIRSGAGLRTLAWAQLVLWNLGTVIVAVADMAVAPAGVVAGSVVLIAALCMFWVGVRDPRKRSIGQLWWLKVLYVALLVFLAGSVVVGTFLAGAVPPW